MSVEFLNLRHLRAFMEVADAHGISAAAHKVHLSQPAVTQAISGLEARLGTKLLDRRTEGMFPTKAGGALLARVRRMFGHLAHGAALAVRIGRREGKPVPDFHLRVTAAQLRALIAIRDAGNFSLAARTLGISQPSIHRAGRDLEKLSGMELFSAGRRGIELTPQAEAFARSVKLAEAELNQGLDDLTRLAGRDSTRITVGSMPLSRTRILPEAIDALLAGSAGVQIRTIDAPYAELLRGLRYGDIDVLIGALRDPVPVDDVVQEPLFEDRLSVVAGPNHPSPNAGTSAFPIRWPIRGSPRPRKHRAGPTCFGRSRSVTCRKRRCASYPRPWCWSGASGAGRLPDHSLAASGRGRNRPWRHGAARHGPARQPPPHRAHNPHRMGADGHAGKVSRPDPGRRDAP